MYPVIRLIKGTILSRGRAHRLLDTLVSDHVCWPWDLDPWMELNNGRTLTLFDLGRIPLMSRVGVTAALRTHGWGMAVAGATVRYRRRVHMFQRFQIHSRILGWDARFLYVEQSMQRRGEVLNHTLLRIAATCETGILAPEQLIATLGQDSTSPALPGWVEAWIEAEMQRPWPPMQGS